MQSWLNVTPINDFRQRLALVNLLDALNKIVFLLLKYHFYLSILLNTKQITDKNTKKTEKLIFYLPTYISSIYKRSKEGRDDA